jgi:hypothetical protein
MESFDDKTPPRLASGRPSLLGTPAGNVPDKDSQTRMLASLERDGKIPASVSSGRGRSRRKVGLAALAVAVIAGAGAFFAFGPFDDASANVAAIPSPRVIPVTTADRPASAEVIATAPPSAAASAAAQIELAASTPSPAASAALAQADAASPPRANPLDKLALNDADTAPAPAHVAAVAPTIKEKAHGKGAAGAKPHAETVAVARPAAARKARKPEDDADTELVAAIIARLDKRGAKPAAPAPVAVSEATPANIASQVHQCSASSDLVEARQCRNRACDGHWGKVDACPAVRAPKTSRGDGVDSGKPG